MENENYNNYGNDEEKSERIEQTDIPDEYSSAPEVNTENNAYNEQPHGSVNEPHNDGYQYQNYSQNYNNGAPYGNGQYRAPQQNGYPYGNNAQNGNPYPYSGNNYHSGNSGNSANSYGSQNYPYSNNHQYAYNNNSGGKKGNGGKIFGIVAGALCVVLIVALVFVIGQGKNKTPSISGDSKEETTQMNQNVEDIITQNTPETSDVGSTTGELSAKAIYKKVLNTSVGILVYGKNNSVASEGSGVLFTEDKTGKYTYIITCAHVIADTNSGIVVRLANETDYTAEVVGYDNRTDIGVLRIEASGLELAEIGDSSKLAVGDIVYAIGNPGGVEFANSFTSGMVSALDRPVNSTSSGYTMECIQHTAAINPGNSGGQLVNTFGQVIGINSMKIVDDEYEGMGFSVPSSVFTKIVNDIIKNGYVTNRPKLGITYASASNYNSYGMFVAIKGLPAGSIVIYSIGADSALAGTEAQEGDMIVAVNGKDLDSTSVLSELLEKSSVGDVITLSLVRINKDYSYKEFTVKAKLIEDRGDTKLTEEKETTQPYNSYDDYFKQFFNDDFFDDFFGGNTRP